MGFVKLNFPVLVQHTKSEGKSSYQIRPLFLYHPAAFNRRFELALNQFKKEIRHYLQGMVVSRANAHELLWYLFNPDVRFEIHELGISIGRKYIEGTFAMAAFKVNGIEFICLPAFGRYIFMAHPDNRGRISLALEGERVIKELLRLYREREGNDFEPENFMTPKGTFVTTVSLSLNVSQAPLPFEESADSWFFDRVQPNENFNGSVEIEKVGYDLNGRYPSELKQSFYRNELVERLSRIIYQSGNTPIVLIGPEGVGKHTVIQEVVRRYIEQHPSRTDVSLPKIWHIDPNRIIAGMMYVGWWQKRLEAILGYIQNRLKTLPDSKSQEPDKLLIDNVVSILRIGKSSQNNMTMNDVLRPYLEKRQIQLILLATSQEWKILQENDRRFSDLFQVIRMQEPDRETAARMVLQQRRTLELQYGCEFNIQAINQLFTIQRNYLRGKALPGSIMRLMNQLAVKYKFQTIDLEEIRREFEDFSGLNERIFDVSYTFQKDEVHEWIAQRLVGQAEAVETLSNTIHTIKARLSPPGKPLGSFLFIGPTGVGKTEGAKILCEYLMGNQQHLMRFDMNEYIDSLAIHRLIGDDHNPEGHLTGQVRYRPFGVILFDEIEKAHPKVHDLLLQVLDDGRLTDSVGRTVDFSNTIIIMTSNVGAKEASIRLGFDTNGSDERAIYQKSLENKFRPEFLNRIDRIVVFNPLQLEHILNIARLQIKDLLKRDGFVRRTTILNISKDALEWVARRGFDARMGGRALKRQIERDLTALSAEQLISTKTDNPILFDILLEGDKLRPKISPLEFCDPIEEDWLPNLPEVARGKVFYNKLLRNIDFIENKVRQMEEAREESDSELIVIGNEKGENLDWQYYDFKDRIASTKQRITNLSLGFRDRHFREGPALPLRLKGSSIFPRKDWGSKGVRQSIKDRLFQQEALKEIRESYEYGAAQFDNMETEFISSYLNVALLRLFAKGFLREKTDQIVLHFHSYITGQGDAEIEYLIDLYKSLFEELDIEHSIDKKGFSIYAEGHSLIELLQGEVGINLFYKAHRNPLPIKTTIRRQNSRQTNNGQQTNQVIRIFDTKSTVTDLRSGFTNAANINAEELKLMVFAGIPSRVRQSLIRLN
ncbi:MAG: AAA family ATPase [Bacteroidota bacterium]